MQCTCLGFARETTGLRILLIAPCDIDETPRSWHQPYAFLGIIGAAGVDINCMDEANDILAIASTCP